MYVSHFPVVLKNLFNNLCTGYSNLSFLVPLVEVMTKTDARSRPTANEAFALFNNLLLQQGRLSLHWLLLESNLTKSDRIHRNLLSVLYLCRRFFRRLASEW